MPKYITIEDGFPGLVDELRPATPNRLGVMSEFWKHSFAYDRDNAWHQVVTEPPRISGLHRFLAHTFWNPAVDLDCQWQTRGKYDVSEIADHIKEGLQRDDDIIQQWFGGDDVIKLLDAATNFDTMLLAVRAICGEHETHAEVEEYVREHTE